MLSSCEISWFKEICNNTDILALEDFLFHRVFDNYDSSIIIPQVLLPACLNGQQGSLVLLEWWQQNFSKVTFVSETLGFWDQICPGVRYILELEKVQELMQNNQPVLTQWIKGGGILDIEGEISPLLSALKYNCLSVVDYFCREEKYTYNGLFLLLRSAVIPDGLIFKRLKSLGSGLDGTFDEELNLVKLLSRSARISDLDWWQGINFRPRNGKRICSNHIVDFLSEDIPDQSLEWWSKSKLLGYQTDEEWKNGSKINVFFFEEVAHPQDGYFKDLLEGRFRKLEKIKEVFILSYHQVLVLVLLGKTRCIKWLLENNSFLTNYDKIYSVASQKGKIDILDMLKDKILSFVPNYNQDCLLLASKENRISILNWWLYSGLVLKVNMKQICKSSFSPEVSKWWQEANYVHFNLLKKSDIFGTLPDELIMHICSFAVMWNKTE
jgi:hypothetical protein